MDLRVFIDTAYPVICTLFTGHPVERVFFMRYTYEFKRECIRLYREGKWPQTPSGIKECNFRVMIRRWVRIEEANDPGALKHKNFNKAWTPDEKLELVQQVLAGNSNQSVAITNGVTPGLLYQWVRKYKADGYNGLVNKKKGRKSGDTTMKKNKTIQPRKLEESEYEELIRLRAENEYIKAEIEVIKKEIALREERQAAQLKARKQRLSKNSEKKDTP